jgi:hypothetical protein
MKFALTASFSRNRSRNSARTPAASRMAPMRESSASSASAIFTKQAEILKVGRGSVYYLPRPVSAADRAIMQRLDRLHLEFPFAGWSMLCGLLVLQGCKIGRRHVREAGRLRHASLGQGERSHRAR